MIFVLLMMAAGGQAAADGRIVASRVIVRERVVIRIPTRKATAPEPTRYREHKGPPCINAADIGGAAVSNGDTVDFILRGGARVRAVLEDACPALDFYSGFYLRPSPDGRICQLRDPVHSRAGGECRITRFRLLEPRPSK